jgi:hypothetical protein
MTAYSSIHSYGLAVRLRTAKTILVEGPSDKKVLARLILQRQLQTSNHAVTCVIDECSLVKSDTSFAGRGAREKVEVIAASLGHLSGQLNWLVDREWEGLDVDHPATFVELPSSAWGIKTKGHSIENYWLNDQILSAYLRMFLGAELPAIFFAALTERFESILRLAAAYSFTARRLSAIQRSLGVVKSTHVAWTGVRYEPNASMSPDIAARGVVADFFTELVTELNKPSLQTAPCAILQWLCHGHLGEEMIRACAANMASSFGATPPIVERIERGAQAEKLSHAADCLAMLDATDIEPLHALIDWAQ